ncbi:MAG: Trimethylamine methyltransferase family protein, partial [uncultured Nocardioidaceae bacterium]
VPQLDAALRDPLRGRDGQARRGLASPGDRDRRRVHVGACARAVPEGGPARRGEHRLPRPRLRPRAGGQGPSRVRRTGAQPRQQHPHRRGRDGVRRRVRPALRAGGRGAARRHHGRLPSVHAAGSELPGARLGRRRDLRAQRHPARLPPPRHDAGPPDADRQGLHGQRGLRGQRPRHHRDGGDPVRRPGGHRADAGVDLAGQLQLAAAVGRPDARRAVRVRRGEPGRRADAVHPHGRDVAGDHPCGAGPADRRGAVRDRARPAHPARLPGDLRVVPVEHRHAVGIADVRHPGVGHRPAVHGADRATLRAPVPVRRRAHLLAGARRAGRLRGAHDPVAHVPGGRQLGDALGRLAGGRARGRLREVRGRRRAGADAAGGVHSVGDRRGLARVRRSPGGRPRRPLPRRHAHHGAVPHLLLPADAVVVGELRALDAQRRGRRGWAGEEDLPGEARGLRAAAARRRHPARARGVRRAPPQGARRL